MIIFNLDLNLCKTRNTSVSFLFTFLFYFNVKWTYAAEAHLFFIFHSTLHSSQSSRFRLKSHPAAAKSATHQKRKSIPANAQKTIK